MPCHYSGPGRGGGFSRWHQNCPHQLPTAPLPRRASPQPSQQGWRVPSMHTYLLSPFRVWGSPTLGKVPGLVLLMSEPGVQGGAGSGTAGDSWAGTPGVSPAGRWGDRGSCWGVGRGGGDSSLTGVGASMGPLSRAELAPDMLRVWGGAEMGTWRGWDLGRGQSCHGPTPGRDFCSCPGLGSAWSQVSLQEGQRG